MKIYLGKELMKHKESIIKVVDNEILHNCNYNGMEYEILPDDFTWIDEIDELDGTILLYKIFSAIEN